MAVEQAEVDQAKVDEFMGRLIQDFAGAGAVPLTLIGIRTGLWAALAGAGPLTPAEVAERSGTAERYVAEWLKAQAAGGYLDYHPDGGRFSLPAEAAAVLADEHGTMLVGGFAQMLLAMSRDWVLVEEGFRSGRGVGWHEHSPEHWEGTDQATAAFVGADLPAWLRAIDGIDDRLRTGGRVADVGCGFGAPTIVMAGQYPASRFWGFDYHDASVARARRAAAAAGVADRVRFEVATAKAFPGDGYDLVVFVDSLHDLGDPAGALAHTRRALAPDGAVLLIEPNGADRVEDNLTPVGRLWYEASTLVCTPNALSQEGQALGTLAGEARLREVAGAAGFSRVRRLPVTAPLNLLLELRP